MSEQEFVPQSYGHDAASEDEEIYQPQYPYSWSGKLDKKAAPRDEPPSSYDELTMQQSYAAQNYGTSAQQEERRTSSGNSQFQQWRYSPDGDAFEHGYRPYNQYQTMQGVPPWARPQRHRGGSVKWALLILFGLFLIKPALILVGLVFAVVGVAIFALLLPFLLVFGLVGLLALIFSLSTRPSRTWYRGRYVRTRYRRGPF